MPKGRPKKTATPEQGNPLIKKETTHQQLECTLTPAEIVNYAKSMGEQINKKKALEDAHKSFSTQSKADIAACDAEINRLNEKITTGREYRLIECEVVKDLEKREKRIVRKDTCTVVRTDALTEAECQMELPKTPEPEGTPVQVEQKPAGDAGQAQKSICDNCVTNRKECANMIPTYDSGLLVKCSGYKTTEA